MKFGKKAGIFLVIAFLTLSMVLTGCGNSGASNMNTDNKAADTGNKLDYPTKPVNMIIAFSSGGSSDVQARIMQKYWNKYVDQPWVFKYVTGAGGAVGFAEIAKSKADGYTLGGVNVPHIIVEPMKQGAQFSIDDFTYICQVVNDPQVLAVRKDSKFKTWQEIIDYAKANPEKLKVGIVGQWSGHGMMLLDLEDKTGIKVAPIVYKGAADQNAALLGGEIDVMIGNVNDVMRSLDQMNVLAVASDQRSKYLPDVPTLKEGGLDVTSDIRRGFVVPKDTDPKVVEYLRGVFKKIQDDADYQADMKKAGQPMEYMSGEDFAKFVQEKNTYYKNLLQKLGLL